MELEHYAVRDVLFYDEERFTGRRKILSPVKAVTAGNVAYVVSQSLSAHAMNAAEIDYLYRVYRGHQDIRAKQKQVREEINNRVTVNYANEIVTFKSAYLLNEPIQYISTSEDQSVSEKVHILNRYMRAVDKESKDKEIVDWTHICGVGVRLVLPNPNSETDGVPFCLYTQDPRTSFVIYNDGIGQEPLAGVILQKDEEGKPLTDVYTASRHYVLRGGSVASSTPTLYNGIPLVEYVNNFARMGAFESVLSILNNINVLESNAVDSIQDFVNAYDVFQNCEIDRETYKDLNRLGAVMIKTATGGMEAKVYRIASELNQNGVQERIDDLKDAYLTIVGMPNRNGGSSTSDTGSAVIYRDGWSEAEARAKDTEKLFVRSEREMLRVVMNICRIHNEGKYRLDLDLADIKTEFLRKNLSNAQSKVQMLCEMLNNAKIHPLDAWEISGVSNDTYAAYRRGMGWYEALLAQQEAEMEKELDNAREQAALRAGGQDQQEPDEADSQAV